MEFVICNVKGKELDKINLDVLNAYTLGDAYNVSTTVRRTSDFMAFDTESQKGRYYSAYFHFHLQTNLVLGFSFNSFEGNKLTISYHFINGSNFKQVTPLTIEEVKDVIRMSNAEEA